MPIVISAVFDIKPEQREDALEKAKPYIDGALSQEGCLAYSWAADPHVPGRIHVFEEWTDAEALAQHFNDRHYNDMRAHMGQYEMLGADAKKYRVDKIEPVYGPDGVATAKFSDE